MSAQPQPTPNASILQTPYEACLYGSITGTDPFRNVFDRLLLRTDNGASPIHIRELIFQSTNPTHSGYGDDQPILVCRRDLLNDKAPWIISTRGKPEPQRLHPLAIVRPAIYAKAQGDVQGFASTLGFAVLQSEHFKRGYLFVKGIVTLSAYQLDTMNVETSQWEKAPDEATWMIEAKTPPTTGLLTPSIEALTDVRDLLKGLVDLDRSNIISNV